MPWELDEAFIAFSKITTLKRILSPEDKIIIHTCLNLSSYLIDWDKTQIPKEFFINKYNYIHKTLYEFDVLTEIYDGPELYGHLDFQRTLIDKNTDYYLSICPDVYFHPHTIYYLIESAKNITDKYFVITPEIPKLWDSSWDFLVSKHLNHYDYNNWEYRNIHEIISISQNISDEPFVEKTPMFKWAGWCDLYNKSFYEQLVPCQKEWTGYGPWDFFGINICTVAKNQFNVNVNQYVLRNQIIFDKDIGIYQNKKNKSPYKCYMYLNSVPDQRQIFENNLTKYMQQWFDYAKLNKII